MRKLCLVVLLAHAIGGCAGTRVLPVTADTETNARGFRYYQASPYLLIHTDNKGGLTSRVVYLPDPNKRMSIEPYNTLATNDLKLDFSNGVLTGATADIDQQVVPKAVLSALQTAAVAALTAADDPGVTGTVPPPRLYKIVSDGTNWKLVGGPPLDEQGNELQIEVKGGGP